MRTIGCFLAFLFLVSAASFAAEKPEPTKNLSGEAILNRLKEKQGEALHEFIMSVEHDLEYPDLNLTDPDIDRIVERLTLIEETDPYQKEVESKGGRLTVFPNRHAARDSIYRFKSEKIANSLRQLPVGPRVARIADELEHPRDYKFGYDPRGIFVRELRRTGQEGVPFMVECKSADPRVRGTFAITLGEIGDPRGVDYIIAVMQSSKGPYVTSTGYEVRALAKFEGKKVVSALVDALQDNRFVDVDRRMPPQMPPPGYKPYMGRCFGVQLDAAQTLTTVTKKNWGLLYNEDYQTWRAWLDADHPDAFSPAAVKRTDKELADLVEMLFHRYMSARPNPWQPQNDLATEEGLKELSAALKQFGPGVVPLLTEECRARICATPLWKKELNEWTKKLLLGLDMPEARKAAERL